MIKLKNFSRSFGSMLNTKLGRLADINKEINKLQEERLSHQRSGDDKGEWLKNWTVRIGLLNAEKKYLDEAINLLKSNID